MNAITPPQSSQRGLAIVEFTIVLPLLLLLMLAAAEFGRALYQYDTLTKAVRDGARYYAQKQHVFVGDSTQLDNTEITNTKNLVVYATANGTGQALLPGLATSTVTTAVNTTNPTGDYVTVSATYTFQFLPGNPLAGILNLFGGNGLGNSLAMTASVVMRVI